MNRHGLVVVFGLMVVAGTACRGPSPEREAARAAKQEARAEKQRQMAPPAGSKLAAIKEGMRETEVEKILGQPDDNASHETGKRWVPYNMGQDNRRTVWYYKGVGRVVFTQTSHFSGQQLYVKHVEHDPSEDGRRD